MTKEKTVETATLLDEFSPEVALLRLLIHNVLIGLAVAQVSFSNSDRDAIDGYFHDAHS